MKMNGFLIGFIASCGLLFMANNAFVTKSVTTTSHTTTITTISDSITQILNGHKITLCSEKDKEQDEFEPVNKNRKIIIDQTFVIDVDSLCKKSELFNPAFNFYSSSIQLVAKKKGFTHFKVFLGQEGCSGDFCRDLIVVEVRIEKGVISYQTFDQPGK